MTQQPFPYPGLEPPEPDPRLRSRVLRAAGQAAAAEARTGALARLVDRLWENRALRLGWLTAIVALLVLNAAVDTGTIDHGALPAAGGGPYELEVPEIGSAGKLRAGSAGALRTTDPVLREELGLRAPHGAAP